MSKATGSANRVAAVGCYGHRRDGIRMALRLTSSHKDKELAFSSSASTSRSRTRNCEIKLGYETLKKIGQLHTDKCLGTSFSCHHFVRRPYSGPARNRFRWTAIYRGWEPLDAELSVGQW